MNPLAQLSFNGMLPPSTLESVMIPQILAANDKARSMGEPFVQGLTWKSFYGERLWDTCRVAAGTALPTSEFQLFRVPSGQSTTEINGTTQYKKSDIDTNMTAAGQLPAGQMAWITSIQCRVTVQGALDDTVQTGDNLGLPLAPGIGSTLVAADDVLAINLAEAFYESILLKFKYNDITFEKGPLSFFPCRYGVSGVSGGFAYVPTTAGTGIMQNETILNNGFGGVWTLPVVRIIDSLFSFGATLQALNPFVPTRNTRIQVILEGLGAKAMTG